MVRPSQQLTNQSDLADGCLYKIFKDVQKADITCSLTFFYKALRKQDYKAHNNPDSYLDHTLLKMSWEPYLVNVEAQSTGDGECKPVCDT